MYTEYVFYDKNDEIASKYFKSVLYDFICAKLIKLADIKEKIAEAEDSDLKSKLVKLCNQHESTLLAFMDLSTKLNEALQHLDSFSRDISVLESESVAEIVSNYVEQQKQSVKNDSNEKASEVLQNSSVDEKNGEQASISEMKDAEVSVSNNEVADDKSSVNSEEEAVMNIDVSSDTKKVDNNTEVVSAKKDEEVTSSEENTVEQTDEQLIESSEKPVENVDNTEKSESDVEKPQDNSILKIPEISENNGQVFSQDLMEKDENSNEVEPEKVENIFPQVQLTENSEANIGDNSSTDIISNEMPIIENSSEIISTVDVPSVDGANDSEVVSNEEPSIDAENKDVSVDVVSSEKPGIDAENKDVSVDVASSEEQGIDAENKDVSVGVIPTINSDSHSIVENSSENDVIPTVIESSDSSTSDLNSIDSELKDNVIFEKIDSFEPKVILTSANQVAKLRASRDSNISLLTAKQFFKFEKVNDGESIVSDVGDNNAVIFEETSVDAKNSSEDIIPESGASKEEQMEQMMQQITELYKDGKVDEAQALSDKVSELNKELQGNQKVLAA